jgi:hypothetical protein
VIKRALVLLALAGVLGSAPALAQTSVPKTLNGLAVKQESIDTPGPRTSRDYLSDIRLYSLRRGKQLEATLQIGRFRGSAPVSSLSFRRSIAARIGSVVPVEHRVGDSTVYVTKSKRLSVAVWFRERDLFILSIREDYSTPKSLIRRTLELDA